MKKLAKPAHSSAALARPTRLDPGALARVVGGRPNANAPSILCTNENLSNTLCTNENLSN